MINVKRKLKIQYYLVLEFFVKQQTNNKIIEARLEQYRIKLLKNSELIKSETKIEELIRSMVNCTLQPWRKKYQYWLICDIALIILDESLIRNASKEMMKYMSLRQQQQVEILINALVDENIDISKFKISKEMLDQYRKNKEFAEQPLHKFILTANMSAGKSTLINAFIGKPIARTSQEVCTSNICYLYNKAFEDEQINLENNSLSIDASNKELSDFNWNLKTSISSYFCGTEKSNKRICFIDTPGVNSAINIEHGRISREALKQELYDKVIYVLNANKLGTDEEINHIKWISENISKDKVIFVLNKLDDYKKADDDISSSVEGVKEDLRRLGFEKPIVCPISAYFGLLIKMKANNENMTDDEKDEYMYYLKKFNKSEYDLSRYYDDIYEDSDDNEIVSMSKKCGLYGLEKILLGGAK